MLKVNEIFYSLQGETSRSGFPTVFVRLTGCPLRCSYCDTEYAFSGGENLSLASILDKVREFGAEYVCVTGGEPLAQKGCLKLLRALCDAGYSVSLETSGALDISQVDQRVSKILDIKTPGSKESQKNLWRNLDCLGEKDEIKFVLCGREDYSWAKKIVLEKNFPCPVIFSPVVETLSPQDLARWILDDRLRVRMQLQLHRMIWGKEVGR